jgi:hypothetical protein
VTRQRLPAARDLAQRALEGPQHALCVIVGDGACRAEIEAERARLGPRLAELLRDRARCEALGHVARDYVERTRSLDVRLRQIEQALLGPA